MKNLNIDNLKPPHERKDILRDMWRQQSTQDWSSYNATQATEINSFDVLLKDLLENVEQHDQKTGRPSLDIRDLIFCTVKKVYFRMSCRRSKGLFDNAAEKDLISHSPNWAATSRILNKRRTTAILRRLIVLSALPLKDLEEHFSVDSSGFRTTNFTEYFNYKHKVSRKHGWIKLHICSGAKTNIITDVRITDHRGADIKQFKPLVRATARNFDIKELSADKAYSSRECYETVDKVGGQALIPFKSNATGKSAGSTLWRKMFYYFKFHQPEFLARYHKRSNVEATFSMMKMKFGDLLRSKNKTAQINELLCKVLAHNLCVLIAESQASGIKMGLTDTVKFIY